MFVQECLASIEDQISITVPTDRLLVQQVAGPNATDNDYRYGGFGNAVGIRSALHSIGMKLADYGRILDFGCG
jgi:hypothetical protein